MSNRPAAPKRPGTNAQPPQAPPVYRPQHAPKTLQPAKPPGAASRPGVIQPRRAPQAPPVYRPAPSVSQAKPSPAGRQPGHAGAVQGLMPPTIQMMRMALPQQKPKHSSVNFIDSGTFQDNPPGTFPVVMKRRAGTVEAILTPDRPLTTGSPPRVEPLGWNYAAQVSVQKPNRAPKPHRGWVRFHLLNEELGGTGRDERNLVPTLITYNSCGQWRNFEEAVKRHYYRGPIAFEVEVDYHQNVVSQPAQAGDDQLHKFPRTITGEFKYFDDQQNQWESPLLNGRVTLNIPAPSVTPGNVEFMLTDCSVLTLTKVFNVNIDLARRLVDMQDLIGARPPATVQALYDFLYDTISAFGYGTYCSSPSDLNRHWDALQSALNRPGGTALRIYPGWQPNNTTAVKRTEHSLVEIKFANKEKLQNLSHVLNLDVKLLGMLQGVDLTFMNSASSLYYNMTFGMHNPQQFTHFDKFQWPQIMSALRPAAHHIGGLRIDSVKTKTEYMHEERQAQLRREEEKRRREEEEQRRREEQERQRQEALRLQQEQREREREQRRQRELPIRPVWAQLQHLVSTFQQGTLTNEGWRAFKRSARDVIEKVYDRLREKLENGEYDPNVNYLQYYDVRNVLIGKFAQAAVKYRKQKTNTFQRVKFK